MNSTTTLFLIFCLSILISPLSYGGGVVGGGSTGGGLSGAVRCKKGAKTQFHVVDYGAAHGMMTAAATCVNGKWVFDNDRYNYKPTKGLNKCEEGKIEYAQKFGRNGNPFARDQICKNGRMVPLEDN